MKKFFILIVNENFRDVMIFWKNDLILLHIWYVFARNSLPPTLKKPWSKNGFSRTRGLFESASTLRDKVHNSLENASA